MSVSRPRYSTIHTRTPAEAHRVDSLARIADERWERERAARGRMTDAEAQRRAHEMGLEAQRRHTCNRSKDGRAVNIRASCQLWRLTTDRVKVRGVTLPIQSYDDGIYAPTWELAFRKRAIRDVDRRLSREREARAGAR